MFLLLSVAGFMIESHADGELKYPQVGMVVGLNATGDRYQLSREVGGRRKQMVVRLLMPLYERDILWVDCLETNKNRRSDSINQRIRMTIQVADGEKVITCEDSPYTLIKKEPHSVVSNFTMSLKKTVLSLFNGLNNQYQSDQLISLATRGQETPLFMPLIGNSGAKLAVGDRDLYLVWNGGVPPYALSLIEEGEKKPVVEMNMLNESHANIKGLSLGIGIYTLQIEDANKKQLRRSFQTVALDRIPTHPGQAFVDVRSKAEKRLNDTVFAAWLSMQDPPMWSLEAYQRVVDIAPQFYPAELLRLRLEGKL
jgi:hypothetical protein